MPTATRPRYTDADRARVAELSAAGLGYKRIGRRLGIPYTTVFRWLHPEYAERSRRAARAAKKRRMGACRRCGAETRYNGHTNVPTSPNGASLLCSDCAHEASRIWTAESIVEAIRRFARRHGRPPTASEWNGAGRPGYAPAATTVVDVCGWANAIELAGFPRPKVGDKYRILRETVCPDCGAVEERESVYRVRLCVSCALARRRDWHDRNRERLNARERERYARRKAEARGG